MGTLKHLSARVERLASRLHLSREGTLPDPRSMTSDQLEGELLAGYEALAGGPFDTFASPAEFIAAMRSTRTRLQLPDPDGSFAGNEQEALEFLQKRQAAKR